VRWQEDYGCQAGEKFFIIRNPTPSGKLTLAACPLPDLGFEIQASQASS